MFWVVSALGLLLFALPFTGLQAGGYLPLVGITLAVLVVFGVMEYATRRLDTRRLALLAGLAAIDAGLRLALVSGIGGFSPVFFLILCAGYVFGPSYGFLTGTTCLLASALATGGIGPWLPYEMFAAGWVGALAGLARRRQAATPGRADLLRLAAIGLVTGFAYGAATDVFDWATYYRGVPDLGWVPGILPGEALSRFGRFYLVTSLAWDAFRAVGNVVMVLLLGTPVLAALSRFRERFSFVIEQGPARDLVRQGDVAGP